MFIFLVSKVASKMEEAAISRRSNETLQNMRNTFKHFDVFHVIINPGISFGVDIEEADGYKMTHEARVKDTKTKNSVNPGFVSGDRPTVYIILPFSAMFNYRYDVIISKERKKILITETKYQLAEASAGVDDLPVDITQRFEKNFNRERVKAYVEEFVENVSRMRFHQISWKGEKKNIIVKYEEINESDYDFELDLIEKEKK